MASPAGAADAPAKDPVTSKSSDDGYDELDAGRESPEGRPTRKRSHDELDKEDPETQAASQNLKNTTISDRNSLDLARENAEISSQPGQVTHDNDTTLPPPKRAKTPDTKVSEDQEMKDKLSSPKKKRGRDTDDDAKDNDADLEAADGSSGTGSLNANGGRTTRSGPEKKRYRDASAEPAKLEERLHSTEVGGYLYKLCDQTYRQNLQAPETTDISTATVERTEPTTSAEKASSPKATTFGSGFSALPQTSSSKFASSGLSALSGAASPFATVASSNSGSVFGGGRLSGFGAPPATTAAAPLSGFGALAAAKSPTPPKVDETATSATSGFGGTATASGFGTLGSGLGGGFGGGSGFGSAFAGGSGPKLSSFASTSTPTIIGVKSKPAKAFGAPESSEDEGSDDEGSDDDNVSEKGEDDTPKDTSDDKKKIKVAKGV
jgi:hypothetical protein